MKISLRKLTPFNIKPGILLASCGLIVFGILHVKNVLSDEAYDGSADFYRQQRQVFMDARKALQQGKYNHFRKLQSRLGDYPIAHYLEYEHLRKQMRSSADVQDLDLIDAFEKRFKDGDLANKLRRNLLDALAEQKKWPQYLQIAGRAGQQGADCDRLLAEVKTGQLNAFDDRSRTLWLIPRSQPEACEQAFTELEKNDPVSVSMVWTRIHRLMDKGRTGDMKQMLGYLSSKDKQFIRSWIDYYPDPQKALTKDDKLREDTDINRRILVNLVERWSKRDAESAHAYWNRIKSRYAFSQSQRHAVEQLIARMAAYDQLPQAHEWLHALKDEDLSPEARFWRIRTAMRRLDWQVVKRDILNLPDSERNDSQWQYWLARASEQLGDKETATKIYRTLAQELSYHGFLAADRLDLPYAISDGSSAAEKSLKARLMGDAKLIRAREYQYAGLGWEGRRDWMDVVSALTPEGQLAAAELAYDWNWADRSVFTVAKTGQKDALALRFPMPHVDTVKEVSSHNRLDSAWIFGVMRRESGFIEDIQSGAGAVGLMQLMPATAKEVAKRHGKNHPGDLTHADNNIRLGSSYLRFVMDKFNDNQILATAAYNAGPHRVNRWLPQDITLPADVWVDTIPYNETRNYVRAVTAYTTIFEWRMNHQITPLHKRMVDSQPNLLVSQR
ncbi:MAG: lytic transglycosylase domain-containing protein [Gammaproteobacteria bacterium]|nr:lytic transglycosylase domain-containing protein [Gammaproteobacteria bacterium]